MRFLKQPVSDNVISTGGCKTAASENVDFYLPQALAALKNASANSSRTATIELLCTSGCALPAATVCRGRRWIEGEMSMR
jgi:hypothetical protein